MATNPAQVTAEVETDPSHTGEKRTFQGAFQEFLRNSPSIITKSELTAALLGTAKGFMTDKDIANRVAVAQTAGHLSTQIDEEGSMKNSLAGKTTRTSAKSAKAKRTYTPRSNGDDTDLHLPPSDTPNPQQMTRAMRVMEDAEILASKALVDPSVTADALARAMLAGAGALHAAMGDNK